MLERYSHANRIRRRILAAIVCVLLVEANAPVAVAWVNTFRISLGENQWTLSLWKRLPLSVSRMRSRRLMAAEQRPTEKGDNTQSKNVTFGRPIIRNSKDLQKTLQILSRQKVTRDVSSRQGAQEPLEQLEDFLLPQRRRKEKFGNDPALGYTLSELEDFFADRERQMEVSRKTASLEVFSTWDDATTSQMLQEFYMDYESPVESLMLDPDIYVKSREWLNADGSLGSPIDASTTSGLLGGALVDDDSFKELLESMLQPAPDSPDVAEAAGTADGRLNDAMDNEKLMAVLQALQQRSRKMQSLPLMQPPKVGPKAEELHKTVFANEQGYLAQSQLFRESLTNSSKAGEAAAMRRGVRFRERRDRAIASLNEQLLEMEEAFAKSEQPFNTSNSTALCSQCLCRMSTEETTVAAGRSRIDTQQLCQVCYGELLVKNSDMSFLWKDRGRVGWRPTNQEDEEWKTGTPPWVKARNIPKRVLSRQQDSFVQPPPPPRQRSLTEEPAAGEVDKEQNDI